MMRGVGLFLAVVSCARGFQVGRPRVARTVARAMDLNDAVKKFERDNGQKVFEALVEYPCLFTIKVIGAADESFPSDMVAYIGRVTEEKPEAIAWTQNASSTGKFTSVTIKAPVSSADQLYECYAILKNDPRVKMAL